MVKNFAGTLAVYVRQRSHPHAPSRLLTDIRHPPGHIRHTTLLGANIVKIFKYRHSNSIFYTQSKRLISIPLHMNIRKIG